MLLKRVIIRETEIISTNFRLRNSQITAQLLEINENIIHPEHAATDNRPQIDLISNLSEKTCQQS